MSKIFIFYGLKLVIFFYIIVLVGLSVIDFLILNLNVILIVHSMNCLNIL